MELHLVGMSVKYATVNCKSTSCCQYCLCVPACLCITSVAVHLTHVLSGIACKITGLHTPPCNMWNLTFSSKTATRACADTVGFLKRSMTECRFREPKNPLFITVCNMAVQNMVYVGNTNVLCPFIVIISSAELLRKVQSVMTAGTTELKSQIYFYWMNEIQSAAYFFYILF